MDAVADAVMWDAVSEATQLSARSTAAVPAPMASSRNQSPDFRLNLPASKCQKSGGGRKSGGAMIRGMPDPVKH
jgi:hypothetical protein